MVEPSLPAAVPPRGSRDLLQLLANPTNRGLLSVLALEPQYPRRLAELVGLTEHEASRRLRAFEKVGLAESSWANLGKTVRLYRLSATKFEVTFGQQGLEVTGLSSKAPRVAAGAVAETPPALTGFVGRADELADLRRALERHRAVVVQGIGGAGKTSLCAALAEQWRRPVLWHTLAPGESAPVMLSRLAAGARPLESPERAQRFTMLHAAEDATLLQAALAETANRVGALVVLDRFEGADASAGEAARALAERLEDGRLLVTTRAWPRELPRDRVGAFALGGLTPPDAERLLASLGVGAPRMADLLRRTKGHPLALRLLSQASAAASTGAAPLEESSLREFLVHDVLPQLSDGERQVLLALSVLRTPFLGEEAEAIADTKGALVALAKLEARGLVLRSGETFAVHDLVRGFAEDVVPDRKLVHARAATVLLGTGEAAKALEALHHMLQAGQFEKAADVVAAEAATGTYRFADLGLLVPYRELGRQLIGSPKVRGAKRAAVEIEMGIVATLAGDAAEARRLFDAARPALGPRDASLKALHALSVGKLLSFDGAVEEAAARLEEARTLATGAGDDRLSLEALVALGYLHESQGRDAAATDAYREASEVARRVGDVRALSVALSGRSRVLSMSGDPRAGPMGQEALDMARVAGYPRGEAAAYMTLVNLAVLTGQRSIPPETQRRYLQIAELLGDPWMLACALTDTAYFLALEGHFDEALRLANRGIGVARTIKSPIFEGSGVFAIARTQLGLGRPREAVAALEGYLAQTGHLLDQWPYMGWRAHELYAEALEASGDPRAAATRRTAAALKAKGGVELREPGPAPPPKGAVAKPPRKPAKKKGR